MKEQKKEKVHAELQGDWRRAPVGSRHDGQRGGDGPNSVKGP